MTIIVTVLLQRTKADRHDAIQIIPTYRVTKKWLLTACSYFQVLSCLTYLRAALPEQGNTDEEAQLEQTNLLQRRTAEYQGTSHKNSEPLLLSQTQSLSLAPVLSQ